MFVMIVEILIMCIIFWIGWFLVSDLYVCFVMLYWLNVMLNFLILVKNIEGVVNIVDLRKMLIIVIFLNCWKLKFFFEWYILMYLFRVMVNCNSNDVVMIK